MNWVNIESQVEKLAITNDTNIWMSIFFNANVRSPPQQIMIFNSLLQKMNNEQCLIFDKLCLGEKHQNKHFVCSLLEVLV